MKLSDVLLEEIKPTAKFKKVMKEFGEGKLKDSHGNDVTDHKQAVAIAASESGQSKPKKEKK